MNVKETIEVCSGDTAERWRAISPSRPFLRTDAMMVPLPSHLLAAYAEGLRHHRLAAIVAGDYLEYKKYLTTCGLQPDHVRYIVTPEKLTQNSLVIRTGTFWNRSDRDALDRRMLQFKCKVYDDWPT